MTKGVWIGALVMCGGLAWADTTRPAPTPSTAAACVGAGPLVYDPKAKLVGACSDDGTHCAGIDPATGAVRSRSRPLRAAPGARITAGGDAVCARAARSSCAKLGPRARTWLRKQRARRAAGDSASGPIEGAIALSEDKAFAILGVPYTTELWDLKKDRPVPVLSWTSEESLAAMPATPVGFVGDLVVFSITPCAGPCTVSRLFTRTGQPVGSAFEGVTTLVSLGPGLAIGVGQEGAAVVVDAKAKQARVWNENGPGVVEYGAVFLHGGALYLAREAMEDTQSVYEILRLKPDGSGKEARVTAPICST